MRRKSEAVEKADAMAENIMAQLQELRNELAKAKQDITIAIETPEITRKPNDA